MENLNKRPSKPLQDIQKKLAHQLLTMHLTEAPSSRLPEYHYSNLKKGIICHSCQTFYPSFKQPTLICPECDEKELLHNAVLRSVEEFKILFPEMKITTNQIFEWCRIIKSKKTIRNILGKNFNLLGYGKSSYYVERD